MYQGRDIQLCLCKVNFFLDDDVFSAFPGNVNASVYQTFPHDKSEMCEQFAVFVTMPTRVKHFRLLWTDITTALISRQT